MCMHIYIYIYIYTRAREVMCTHIHTSYTCIHSMKYMHYKNTNDNKNALIYTYYKEYL